MSYDISNVDRGEKKKGLVVDVVRDLMADAVDQPLEADGRSFLLHVGGQCVEGHCEARDEANRFF